jgi:hypothetical protein
MKPLHPLYWPLWAVAFWFAVVYALAMVLS